jgi:glycine oxidase
MKPSATIIGGGVIGLSIAYELLQRDWQVTVVDRGQFGKAASWAAAGILLPANRLTAEHPLEHLSALSNNLHIEWASQLKSETGIDNGHHQCGGLYVARTPGEIAALTGLQFQLADEKISHQLLDHHQVASLDIVKNNSGSLAGVRKAISLTHESQVCNPNHIRALIKACQLRSAQLIENSPVRSVTRLEDNGRVQQVQLECGTKLASDKFVFTAGAWTDQILGFESLPMLPVRGQMVMFKLPRPIFEPIIYEGSHYLVPRKDGHVLAGATIEEAGFECNTTVDAVEMLTHFANRQFPQLNVQTKVKQWAGLRPTTFDGFPYIGSSRTASNAYVATGHFRLGIQLSTGTAKVIADLMEEKTPTLDLTAFSPNRIVG